MKKVSLVLALVMAALLMAGSAMAADKVLKFAWEHDDPADVAEWKIYAKTSSWGQYGEPIAVVANSGPPYIFTAETTLQVTSGTSATYRFVATATDAAGNESGHSNEISETISIPDETPPNTPISLTVTIEVVP